MKNYRDWSSLLYSIHSSSLPAALALLNGIAQEDKEHFRKLSD